MIMTHGNNLAISKHIPIEVIQDILQYLCPRILHKLASYSQQARYIINGMRRAKYIEKWLDTYVCYELDMYTISKRNMDKDMEEKMEEKMVEKIVEKMVEKMVYVLENYWYLRLCVANDIYPVLLKIIDRIGCKMLSLSFMATCISDEDINTGVLSNVHTLDFSNCPNIKNIRLGALDNVHHLDLDGCHNLDDKSIQALANIHNLDLSTLL